ncbi:type II toxin-antitoxin system PemK/MazF family toxin [Pseudolysinimonas sp.]|jgi:mRNA interferase MazF|uniref:type II toxin-antitoxin system PemK/MazF family toxin n=1 Tax=Pseudolysinimonas sp. TaxID=2680009 RepID=UPI00378379CE
MELFAGAVVWVDLEPTRGREQGGIRPGVVISSSEYLESVDSLATVIPVTTRDREWPNHVLLTGMTGLTASSWAMTEQMRSIARERIVRWSGSVDVDSLDTIRLYLRDALDL